MNSEMGQFETTIGPSVKVEGDLNTNDNIRIDGTVTGTVKTKANLNVGPTAVIDASVEAGSAMIAGKITGNITVRDRLELESSAQVEGDIVAGSLQIAAGAIFNGKCEMKTTTADLSNDTVSESIESKE